MDMKRKSENWKRRKSECLNTIEHRASKTPNLMLWSAYGQVKLMDYLLYSSYIMYYFSVCTIAT